MARFEARRSFGAIERRLLDAMGTGLSRAEARRVLRRALDLAELEEVPDDPAGFLEFVCGPLPEALEERVGAEAAEGLLEGVDSLFAPKSKRSSGVRRQTPRTLDRGVLMLSTSGPRAAALRASLAGRARFERVADVFSLLDAVDSSSHAELVLVIDEGAPSISGPIVETLRRAVPSGAELVFWGADPPAELPLPLTSFAASATSADVAAACLERVASGARPRVVLADPDPVWRATLERELRRAGYDVCAVTTGFEALEACVDARPALVLTDFRMPLIDGVRLATLLTTRFAPSPPPILLVTATRMQRPADVDAVFAKDTPLDTIVAAVRARAPSGEEPPSS